MKIFKNLTVMYPLVLAVETYLYNNFQHTNHYSDKYHVRRTLPEMSKADYW